MAIVHESHIRVNFVTVLHELDLPFVVRENYLQYDQQISLYMFRQVVLRYAMRVYEITQDE